MQEKLEKLKEFYSQHTPESIMLGMSALCCLVALSLFVSSFSPTQNISNDIKIDKDEDEKPVSRSMIYVDVAGAVKNPGVYSFPVGTRFHKAIIAAGGLANNADLAYFYQNINQARKIQDEEKIFIPAQMENSSFIVNTNLHTSTSASLTNINEASESELESLPGIGKVTAEQIINGRPYSSIEELLSRKVLKTNVYTQVKELITLE